MVSQDILDVGAQNDCIELRERGLGDREVVEPVWPKVDGAQLGQRIRSRFALNREPGVAVAARHWVGSLTILNAPIGFELGKP